MNNSFEKRLCLGTAQFGLDYGIANKNGRVSKEETFNILEYAYDAGIDMLDTACLYGNSEKIIGEFISKSAKAFKVISKTPRLDNESVLKLEQYCLQTLESLNQKRLYGYLAHRFDDLPSHKEVLWNEMESLKAKGMVDKIGVSLYKPEELEYLLDNNAPFDIIQIPCNVFDQRFKRHFSLLKDRGVEIYARSVFLQGLFFIGKERIEKNFQPAQERIEKLRSLSEEHNIPANALYLCFVLLNAQIGRVVIGVDSLEQLKENINSLVYMDRVKDIYDLLEGLELDDEEVILPFNWR